VPLGARRIAAAAVATGHSAALVTGPKAKFTMVEPSAKNGLPSEMRPCNCRISASVFTFSTYHEMRPRRSMNHAVSKKSGKVAKNKRSYCKSKSPYRLHSCASVRGTPSHRSEKRKETQHRQATKEAIVGWFPHEAGLAQQVAHGSSARSGKMRLVAPKNTRAPKCILGWQILT
jgi:hypothetical protein